MHEDTVQTLTRLEAARAGLQIWRNNVGACRDDTGRMIRYGLANESAAMNKHIKSSDLIGITPTYIMPHMLGMTLGVFTAFELKASGWKFSQADERAVAQAKFHAIVREAGGFAGFVSEPQQIYGIIGR
jgi:hypothetical protein